MKSIIHNKLKRNVTGSRLVRGFAVLLVILPFVFFQSSSKKDGAITAKASYPRHERIIASMFYVGEGETSSNNYISNVPSAWDEQWAAHYGGVDLPESRKGWLPGSFTPKENPFYIALPYDDLDEKGNQKPNSSKVYWTKGKQPRSQLKNRWIQVCKANACAYGQWEDVGPFKTDDVDYVFGSRRPSNTFNLKAGIDVSPALNDYLNINGDAIVSWRFVDENDVPAGPWKQIVTRN